MGRAFRPLTDDTPERREIRRLRRENCKVRLALRLAEKECERLRGVESAFEQISGALAGKARA